MNVINALSVSEALSEGLFHIRDHHTRETSRNGDVLVANTPVMTVYERPLNRVLFSPLRNANPFFHLMEALWMIGGRNDLLFPLLFNSRFREYSDDGSTIWGAYGWRWRRFFGYDQLNAIVRELKARPNSRRAVLTMWNPYPDVHEDIFESEDDLSVAARGGKDVPCNTHAYFDLRGGKLNMTVCNRSNDAIWGAYGANAVHFSILLEYMAALLGVEVGVYRQFSNNLHVYEDVLTQMVPEAENTYQRLTAVANDAENSDMYYTLSSMPLVDCAPDRWHQELEYLLTRNGLWNEHARWDSAFLGGVARPMFIAYDEWRNKQYDTALKYCDEIKAEDWGTAATEWLQRRIYNKKEKQQ